MPNPFEDRIIESALNRTRNPLAERIVEAAQPFATAAGKTGVIDRAAATLPAVWKGIKMGVSPTQLGGHVARALESGKPSEGINALDTMRERGEQELRDYRRSPEARRPTLFGDQTAGDVVQNIAPQMPQTLEGLVGGAAGAIKGARMGPWGAAAGGIIGALPSLLPAYHESQTRTALAVENAEDQKRAQAGLPPLSLGEKQALEQRIEPQTQKIAAAEVGTELPGMALEALPVFGPLAKLGTKPLASAFSKEALKAGGMAALKGMGATALTEPVEEAASTMMQQPIERELGLTDQPAYRMNSGEDWKKAFDEVTGPTLVGMIPQMLLGGGLAGVGTVRGGRQLYERNTQLFGNGEEAPPEAIQQGAAALAEQLSARQAAATQPPVDPNQPVPEPLSKDELGTLDFLQKNINDPTALAKQFGMRLGASSEAENVPNEPLVAAPPTEPETRRAAVVPPMPGSLANAGTRETPPPPLTEEALPPIEAYADAVEATVPPADSGPTEPRPGAATPPQSQPTVDEIPEYELAIREREDTRAKPKILERLQNQQDADITQLDQRTFVADAGDGDTLRLKLTADEKSRARRLTEKRLMAADEAAKAQAQSELNAALRPAVQRALDGERPPIRPLTQKEKANASKSQETRQAEAATETAAEVGPGADNRDAASTGAAMEPGGPGAPAPAVDPGEVVRAALAASGPGATAVGGAAGAAEAAGGERAIAGVPGGTDRGALDAGAGRSIEQPAVAGGVGTEPSVTEPALSQGQTAEPTLAKVKTLDGNTLHVRQQDLDGDRELLPVFNAKGQRVPGKNSRVHRENLDPTGEKAANAWKDLPSLEGKDGKGYPNEPAARKAIRDINQPQEDFQVVRHPDTGRWHAYRKAAEPTPETNEGEAAANSQDVPETDVGSMATPDNPNRPTETPPTTDAPAASAAESEADGLYAYRGGLKSKDNLLAGRDIYQSMADEAQAELNKIKRSKQEVNPERVAALEEKLANRKALVDHINQSLAAGPVESSAAGVSPAALERSEEQANGNTLSPAQSGANTDTPALLAETGGTQDKSAPPPQPETPAVQPVDERVPPTAGRPADAVETGGRDGQGAAVAGAVANAPEGLNWVEHTTGKGKTLRGIVRKDLTVQQAKEIDPFTFKKDGGFFIRDKHALAERRDGIEIQHPEFITPAVRKAFREWQASGEDTYFGEDGRRSYSIEDSAVHDGLVEFGTTSTRGNARSAGGQKVFENRLFFRKSDLDSLVKDARPDQFPDARKMVEEAPKPDQFVNANKMVSAPDTMPSASSERSESAEAMPQTGQPVDLLTQRVEQIRSKIADLEQKQRQAEPIGNASVYDKPIEQSRKELADYEAALARRDGAATTEASSAVEAVPPEFSDLTAARNHLIDLRTQAQEQGRLSDARLQDRIQRQERLIKQMEAEAKEQAPPVVNDSLTTEAPVTPEATPVTPGAGAATPEAQAADQMAKDPWEMTRDEWFERKFATLPKQTQKAIRAGDKSMASMDDIRRQTDDEHRRMIAKDVADGKPVPANVLAEYPELSAETPLTPSPSPAGEGNESAPDKSPNLTDTSTQPPKKRRVSKKAVEARDVDRETTGTTGRASNEGPGAGPVPGTVAEQSTADVSGREGGGNRGGGRGTVDAGSDQNRPVRSGSSGARSTSNLGSTASAGASPANVPDVPRGNDYRIPAGGLTREGSWLDTARRNVEIVELVHRLESENRPATPEEQAQLVKFTGWGAADIRNQLFPAKAKSGRRYDPSVLSGSWKELGQRVAEVFTAEDWKTALRSTQYAHYTSEEVVRAAWQGAERLGFAGGAILEPGAGIGHFAGLMPDGIYRNSRYLGIEQDGFTARIAQLLYPGQTLRHADYVRNKVPRAFFDLAIGNPPFASVAIVDDPEYARQKFPLHDYFFAKSMDRVRPGGLLIFVTSRFTLDKQGDKARRYLSERADLLGAIRLPNTAFKANAGTQVVTDVLFLRKRDPADTQTAGESWLGLGELKSIEGEAVPVNEYFARHPDMVLGQITTKGDTLNPGEAFTLNPLDDDLAARLAEAIQRLPQNVYSVADPAASTTTAQKTAIEKDWNPKYRKEGGVYLSDAGELMRVENGVGVALADQMKLSAKEKEWLTDYVPLRDALKQAQYDQLAEGNWQASLKALNKAYDAFVKKHGQMLAFTESETTKLDADGEEEIIVRRRFKNERMLRADIDGKGLMLAIEKITEDGTIVKAAILKDRVLKRPAEPKIESVDDALAVSLAQAGRFDLAHVARLAGMEPEQALRDLGDLVYEAPGGGQVLAEEYLSGDVRTKLDEAEAAAAIDRKFARNVEALSRVQPPSLVSSDVTVGLGATWVPMEYYQQYAQEVVGLASPTVTYHAHSNEFEIASNDRRQLSRKESAEWGTKYRSPLEIFDAAMNRRTVKVYVGAGTRDDPRKLDPEETKKVETLVRRMEENFSSWVWTDAERTGKLLDVYNDKFNRLAPRFFNGDHIQPPGLSLKYKLHPHQKRAIWRAIVTGNTYFAHAVGAGKTLEMIIAGMEQKRLGLIKKPLYVVPNHMLEQFAAEFLEAYPAANIMVADQDNFAADNRRRFIAQASLNNPDAIVITHSAFTILEMKPENQAAAFDDVIDDLRASLEELPDDFENKKTRSKIEAQLERIERAMSGSSSERFTQRKKLEALQTALAEEKKKEKPAPATVKKLQADIAEQEPKARKEELNAERDKSVLFEDMGVDFLFVDEAHEFRKLDYATKMNVKGLSPEGSVMALKLFVKTRWLEKQRKGRSFAFASGTPITNTMAELFTIQRFFQEDELRAKGLIHFDAWAANFARVKTEYERNATGGWEGVDRMSKFVNVADLMTMMRQHMDVLTSSELAHLVKLPTPVPGNAGKRNILVTPQVPELEAYMNGELSDRLEASRKWKPSKEQPNNPDPVIAIITDGRVSALDMRYIDPSLPNNPDSKLNKLADRIIEHHRETANLTFTDPDTGKIEPIKGGTQIVFASVGFGPGIAKSRGFDGRAWLNKRLKEAGIPSSEIAWIWDYPTPAAKQAMFKEMRQGKKRILIGSPKNMGTGVNVQKRLTHKIDLDSPWYPSDMEQPDGRILRQGNQNEFITLEGLATDGTYDSTMYSMVARKSSFIEQAFRGDRSLRVMDDISESSGYAMAAAIASGDPRYVQMATLESDVAKLESAKELHDRRQVALRRDISGYKRDVPILRKQVETAQRVASALQGSFFYSGRFDAVVDGREFRGVKSTELGEAVANVLDREMQRAMAAAERLALNDQRPGKDEGVGPKHTHEVEQVIGKVGGKAELVLLVEADARRIKKDGKLTNEIVRTYLTGGTVQLRVAGELQRMPVDSWRAEQSLNRHETIGRAITGQLGELQYSAVTKAKKELDDTLEALEKAEKGFGTPFPQQAELVQAVTELANLRRELSAEGKEVPEAAVKASVLPDFSLIRPVQKSGEIRGNYLAAVYGVPGEAKDDAPKFSRAGLTAGGNDQTPIVPSADQREVQALNRAMVRTFNDPAWSDAYVQADMPDVLAEFAEAAEAAFGSRVIGIATSDPRFDQFNGVNVGGRNFINVNADVGFVQTAGHELLHQLKRNRPDLYRWFVNHARRHYQDFPEYQAKYRALQKKNQETPSTLSAIEEELLGDFTGDAFADPKFVEKLAKADPSRFKQLLNAVINWLKQVGERLSGKGLGSSQYFKDVETLREHLANALVAYAQGGAVAVGKMDGAKFSRGDLNNYPDEREGSGIEEDPEARFDEDPQALFAEVDAVIQGTTPLKEAKGELDKRWNQFTGYARRQWLGALTVHQLTEIGKDLMPRMSGYLKEMNAMDVTRNSVLHEVDAISKPWEALSRVDQGRLALVMHESTLAGVDGAEEYTPSIDLKDAGKQIGILQRRMLNAGGDPKISTWMKEVEDLRNQVRFERSRSEAYGQIRALFRGLSPAAKAVYLQARDYHVDQSKRVEQALVEMINQSRLSGRQRAAAIANLRREFESQRVQAPYFPLARQGDYWVSVRAANAKSNDQNAFYTYQTIEEQEAAIKAFKAEGSTIMGRGKQLEGLRDLQGVPVAFVAQVEDLIGQLGDFPAVAEVRDQVYQLYLKSLPDLSARKHFIHRKKTPGFGEDALRAFATKGYHDAYQLARIQHGFAMRQTMEKMKEDLEAASSKSRLAALRRQRALLSEFKDEVLNKGMTTNEVLARAESLSAGMMKENVSAKSPRTRGERFLADEWEKWKQFHEWMQDWAKYGDMPNWVEEQLADIATRMDTAQRINRAERGYEKASNLYNELQEAYAHLMNPTTGRWANIVNQVGYLWHLAFSPAAWITNATQTPLITMPYVSAKFGMGKTTEAFSRAYREAMRGAVKGGKEHPLGIREALTRPDEIEAYDAALDMGLIDRGRAMDLAGVAEEGASRSGWHRKFAVAMTVGFHDAERLNREVSFMASYRLALADGLSHDAAVAYAGKVINDTHFNYTSENRPRFLRSDIMRVLGQFKLYSQHVTYLQWRALKQALGPNANAEERREARRFLLTQTGVQLMAGGVLGLPLGIWATAAVGAGGMVAAARYGWVGALGYAATVIAAAVALGGDDDDDPREWQAEFQQTMAEWLGSTGGEAASKGLINALAGVDLSTRVSQGELWWRSLDADLDDKELWGEILQQVAGAGLGTGASIIQGLQLAGDGHVERGIEKMVPKATKDVLQALRFTDEGAKTLKGDTLVEDLSPWELGSKAAGFTPSRLAERYDENSAEKRRQRKIEDRRRELVGRVADARIAASKARQAGDLGDVEDAEETASEGMTAIQRFNQMNPGLRITPKTLQQSVKSRNQARMMAQNGVFLNRKLPKQYDYAE